MPSCHPICVAATSFEPTCGSSASRVNADRDTGRSTPVPSPASTTPANSIGKLTARAHSRNPNATTRFDQLNTRVIPNLAQSTPTDSEPAAMAKFKTALSAPISNVPKPRPLCHMVRVDDKATMADEPRNDPRPPAHPKRLNAVRLSNSTLAIIAPSLVLPPVKRRFCLSHPPPGRHLQYRTARLLD